MYRRAVRSLLEQQPMLHTIQGTVARLLIDDGSGRVTGIETLEGRRFGAAAVVITAGTFLRGRLHIGTDTRIAGGRAGDPPAIQLAEQLDTLGLVSARFKTGTPPRIDGRSVDYSRLDRQESEIEQFDYSWSHFWETPRAQGSATRHPPQLPCWITFAGESTKRIVSEAERLGCAVIVMGGDPPRNRLVGDFIWSQEPYRVRRRAGRPVYVVTEDV